MRSLCAVALWLVPAFATAQEFVPPPGVPPEAAVLKAIAEKSSRLDRALSILRRQGVGDPFLAEIEVYAKAADWITRHGEFFQKESADWALEALDRGLLRASQQAMGEAPWIHLTGFPVVRAYRSRVDNSVQPYAVTLPHDYLTGKTPRPRRLDVVLHPRNARLNEVSFVHQFNGDRPAPKDRDYIQIDIYGRGNNAYRWAGETDVYDVIDHFLAVENALGRGRLVDLKRVVLRGFSMGGAGTWHLGLHRPDRWCVLGPGAGFTTTRGYVGKLPDPLPDYQEACLHIYDAVDYAENVANVPVVAYSGDQDKQIAAARNIEARLKGTNLSITHLVAPGLEHKFPPEWQAKAEVEYAKHATTGRSEYPSQVRFVTWTMRYSSSDWVEVLGLEKHYEKAVVDAKTTEKGYKVTTANVRALHLTMPPAATGLPVNVEIDKDELEARPYMGAGKSLHLYLEKRNGHWRATLPEKLATARTRQPEKVTGLQGPIDDAFTAPFLCVRGTGKPWHEGTQQHAEKNLERFQAEWDRFFRGRLPVKDDTDVKPEDIAGRHLILFGDPSSNSLIAEVLDGLPLAWTKDSITLAGRKVDAKDHLPVLIFPSPLNTDRYVVLNSGHTFRAADFLGTNALLYPRLGDYGLLRLVPTEKDALAHEVVTAGLFDEFWRVKK